MNIACVAKIEKKYRAFENHVHTQNYRKRKIEQQTMELNKDFRKLRI